jgi:hypothetical protein
MPAAQAQVAGGPRGAVPGVGGTPAAGYDHLRGLLSRERCVLLDGGIATRRPPGLPTSRCTSRRTALRTSIGS